MKKNREKIKTYINKIMFFLWKKFKKTKAGLRGIGNWRLANKRKFFSLLVFVLILIVIFNWQKFSALAQSVVDSFSTSDKVADQWNTTVDTENGEVRLAERTCDDSVWDCAHATICANMLGDGDYIIVADADETMTKQWKTTDTSCDQPECGVDGAQSTDNLVADNTVAFTDYPAREACKAIGGRLPTKTELQCIYSNMSTFGDNFNTSSSYWSSTETSESNAWYVNFGTGYAYNFNKTSSRTVRCVIGW